MITTYLAGAVPLYFWVRQDFSRREAAFVASIWPALAVAYVQMKIDDRRREKKDE